MHFGIVCAGRPTIWYSWPAEILANVSLSVSMRLPNEPDAVVYVDKQGPALEASSVGSRPCLDTGAMLDKGAGCGMGSRRVGRVAVTSIEGCVVVLSAGA